MRMRRLTLILALLLLPVLASAQRVHRSADEWLRVLEAPQRLTRLKALDVVAALKLKPGQTIADIGAGTGVLTLPMARAVGGSGVVYAVDLEKEAVDYIEERATEQGIVNVKAIVGTADDPGMPVNVDLALLNDSLRYIEKRAEYLKLLGEYLNPGGRIAISEFLPAAYPDRADPALTVSEAEATGWMAAAGLKPIEKISTFADRWFVIYGK
jgi:ubiquinone/menaquinone biosynthesis C-methylase UbiE